MISSLLAWQQVTQLKNAILLIAVPDCLGTNYCYQEVDSQTEFSMWDVWECPWDHTCKRKEAEAELDKRKKLTILFSQPDTLKLERLFRIVPHWTRRPGLYTHVECRPPQEGL